MILDKEKLLEDGYLAFDLKEIDSELYSKLLDINKDEFESIINHMRIDATIDVNIQNYENNINDICNEYIINENNQSFITTYSASNININNKYKNKFSDFDELYKGITPYISQLFQRWFWGTVKSESQPNDLHKDHLLLTMNGIYKKMLKELYNKEHTFEKNIDLTLYTRDCFICPHEDGIDNGRLCVILVYLNDDYQEGFGGEIKVKDEIVSPTFGKVVILDFTKHNPRHEVLPVINEGFKRYALIKFFYL